MADRIADVSFNRIPLDILTRWRTVRDVIDGDQSLRAGSYLPTLNALDTSEFNTSRNNAYRERAVFYAATGFTLEGMMGLAFRVDPRTNLPPKLDYLLTDVDGGGTSLYQQSQIVLSNTTSIGRDGLYSDWSDKLRRPVIKRYNAEDIINWRYEMRGGQRTLVLVVLREETEAENGPFGLETLVQFRELRLVGDTVVVRLHQETNNTRVQVKQRDANNMEVDELVLRSQLRPFDHIPFRFIGSRSNNGDIDPAPMYGIAKVNIGHFRNSADYEDMVWYIGQVQPWISGLTPQWRDWLMNPTMTDATGVEVSAGSPIYWGSRRPLLLPEHGQAGIIQAQPNTLAGEAMEKKEGQMVALGARMIEAVKVNKTATGEDNDREATTSVLSMCCSNTSEGYQDAIRDCALYLGMADFDASDAYKINQDFVKAAADPSMMAQLVASWQSRAISKKDVRNYFRKQGVIPTERSDEDIEADLLEEGLQLGTLNEDGTPKPKADFPENQPGESGLLADGTPDPRIPIPEGGPAPAKRGPNSTPGDPRGDAFIGTIPGGATAAQSGREGATAAQSPAAAPAPAPQPMDIAPLVKAINDGFAALRENAPEPPAPQPPQDLTPLVQAIRDAIAAMLKPPAPPPPPDLSPITAAINLLAAREPPPDVAPLVVAAINALASRDIPIPIINMTGQRDVDFKTNAQGDIIGATLKVAAPTPPAEG